jgi:hypothetical protein
MYRYRIYGFVVECDEALPSLQHNTVLPGDHSPSEVALWLSRSSIRQTNTPSRWSFSYRSADGRPWLDLAADSHGFLLSFPSKGDFRIFKSADRAVCLTRPVNAAQYEMIKMLAVDQVLPFLASLRAEVVLHATAMVLPEGICAFVGPSGVGKSTLLGSFAQLGYPAFCDDCLVLHETNNIWHGFPGHQAIRLWADSTQAIFRRTIPIGSKLQLAQPRDPAHALKELPLLQIVILMKAHDTAESAGINSIGLKQLTPAEALRTLIRSTYRLNLFDPAAIAREFSALCGLAKRVVTKRLCLPHDFAQLALINTMILDDLHNIETTQRPG